MTTRARMESRRRCDDDGSVSSSSSRYSLRCSCIYSLGRPVVRDGGCIGCAHGVVVVVVDVLLRLSRSRLPLICSCGDGARQGERASEQEQERELGG